MRILLDTHAFIWFVEDDHQLPGKLKATIEKPSNRIFLSIISLWEIAIKIQLKKLVIGRSIDEIIELVLMNGFEILPLLPEHIVKLSTLDFFHRDPFDRMIIAQVLTENIEIVSKDKAFDEYQVQRIWQ